MKRLLLILTFILLSSTAFADRVYWYNATSLTGGATSSLDNINGQNLINNDKAIVVTASGQTYIYNLDSDSALSESSPSVISPDSNAGDKRWILMWSGGRVIIPDSTIDQGDNTIAGTLAWHITNASGNDTTVTVLAGTYKITTNITAPVTMLIEFKKGALFKPDATKKLTVYSPSHIVAPKRQQIIDMTNNSTDPLAFTQCGVVYPHRLGMSVSESAANNASALDVAIDTGCDLLIPVGNYAVTAGQFDIDNNGQEVRGESRNSTILTMTGADYGIQISGSEVVLENLYVQGNADTTYGIYLANGATLATIRNIEIIGIRGTPGWAIANENQAYSLLIDRLIVWACDNGVKLIKRADNSVIANSLILGTGAATDLTGIEIGDDTDKIAMISIRDTDIENWATRNLYVIGAQPLTLSGIYSETTYDADSRDLEVGGSSYSSRIDITGFYTSANATGDYNFKLGYNCNIKINSSYLYNSATGTIEWNGVTADDARVEVFNSYGNFWPNSGVVHHAKAFTGSSNEVTEVTDTESETKASDGNARTWGITLIDSNAGARAITLPDGEYTGQQKRVGMSEASNASTLSVTHHETSDPEVFTFNATTDYLILEWDGTDWGTVKNRGVGT